MTLSIRTATFADTEEMAANHLRAYPMADAGSLEERLERLREKALWPIETCAVAERDGALVGQYRSIPFRGWLGGVDTRVGGLAGVAVAPEARRTGVAAALVRDHLARLREEGVPWAMLYPFAPSFYAAFGWAPASRRLRWRLPAGALPRFEERRRVVRVPDLEAVQAAYEAHCRFTNGSLSRDPRHTARIFKDALIVGVRGEGGALSGYLAYRIQAPTARPQVLLVRERIALDVDAERALLGFLAAQADQVDQVVMDTPVDHPLAGLLDLGAPAREEEDWPMEHHRLGEVFAGIMARVVDLAGALRGRGYGGATGRVGFRARDAEVPGNDEPLTLTVDDGVPAVERGRAAVPCVEGGVGPLSAVLVGALGLLDAVRLGRLKVEGSPAEIAAADALLRLKEPYPLVVF